MSTTNTDQKHPTPTHSTSTNTAKPNDVKANHSVNRDGKLEAFFHDEIKDIYWAEQKMVKTLPKLAKAATSDELRNAFESHLAQTKEHVSRLEKVFQILGHKPEAKKCDAMEGITEEGASIIDDTETGTATRDVALVLAGQKAEHYEIATYGGLAKIARTLGHQDVAKLLETTLGEEKKADDTLSGIADNSANPKATTE